MALVKLDILTDCSLTEVYMKTRAEETLYGRFLAGLSAHLTLSLPEKLCDYFNFTKEEKDAVISSQTAGLTFLLNLDSMDVINPYDVRALETPLHEFRLIQAVAKVTEYQSLVEEEEIKHETDISRKDKQSLFINCLRKKIRSWYETMTPVPW
ncbi:hypothetical protein, partial [Salmonella sp. S146_54837]|uniref:hypothetical protein n=1 Tax=Salmonella sp. S146_54837 TaxID=2665635 RepID=UPI00165983F2